MLLKAGADADKARADGMTPLFIACQNGHKDLVKMLFFTACKEGTEAIVDEFLDLDKEKDVNQSDSEGKTALWYALKNNHWSVAKKLINHGAKLRGDLSGLSLDELKEAGFAEDELKEAGLAEDELGARAPQTFWDQIVGFFVWLVGKNAKGISDFCYGDSREESRKIGNESTNPVRADELGVKKKLGSENLFSRNVGGNMAGPKPGQEPGQEPGQRPR